MAETDDRIYKMDDRIYKFGLFASYEQGLALNSQYSQVSVARKLVLTLKQLEGKSGTSSRTSNSGY